MRNNWTEQVPTTATVKDPTALPEADMDKHPMTNKPTTEPTAQQITDDNQALKRENNIVSNVGTDFGIGFKQFAPADTESTRQLLTPYTLYAVGDCGW